MADPNQTPKRGNWVCPCNGCKRAAKQVIDKVVDEYKSCPNVEEIDGNLYCTVWYKHDDCERIRVLLYKITNNDLYTLPKNYEDGLLLTEEKTYEILNHLKGKEDK